jgi:hypothetical protein
MKISVFTNYNIATKGHNMKLRYLLILTTNLICAMSYGASTEPILHKGVERSSMDAPINVFIEGLYLPWESPSPFAGRASPKILKLKLEDLRTEILQGKIVETFLYNVRYLSQRNLFDGMFTPTDIIISSITVEATFGTMPRVAVTDTIDKTEVCSRLMDAAKASPIVTTAKVSMSFGAEFIMGEAYDSKSVPLLPVPSKESFLAKYNGFQTGPLQPLILEDFEFTSTVDGLRALTKKSGVEKAGRNNLYRP